MTSTWEDLDTGDPFDVPFCDDVEPVHSDVGAGAMDAVASSDTAEGYAGETLLPSGSSAIAHVAGWLSVRPDATSSHVEYVILVAREESAVCSAIATGGSAPSTWTVFRRYREFVDVAAALKRRVGFAVGGSLPPKRPWWRTGGATKDAEFLLQRQVGLAAWLSRVLEAAAARAVQSSGSIVSDSWWPELRIFLTKNADRLPDGLDVAAYDSLMTSVDNAVTAATGVTPRADAAASCTGHVSAPILRDVNRTSPMSTGASLPVARAAILSTPTTTASVGQPAPLLHESRFNLRNFFQDHSSRPGAVSPARIGRYSASGSDLAGLAAAVAASEAANAAAAAVAPGPERARGGIPPLARAALPLGRKASHLTGSSSTGDLVSLERAVDSGIANAAAPDCVWLSRSATACGESIVPTAPVTTSGRLADAPAAVNLRMQPTPGDMPAARGAVAAEVVATPALLHIATRRGMGNSFAIPHAETMAAGKHIVTERSIAELLDSIASPVAGAVGQTPVAIQTTAYPTSQAAATNSLAPPLDQFSDQRSRRGGGVGVTSAPAQALRPLIRVSAAQYSLAEPLTSAPRWIAKQPARSGGAPAKPRVGIDHFELLSVLGKGAFGKVLLVRLKSTRALYAMKVLSKAAVMSRRQVGHTLTERRVLSSTSHAFILRLRWAFQTRDKLFLVTDFAAGGELFFHLFRHGPFPEAAAAFYAAELTLALGHLHSRGVVYRDLKPENVLLDADGHVLLADFGLSKEDVRDAAEGASSFCGTAEYLSPEVVRRGGEYGLAVDWWALGAFTYEMIAGAPPWYTTDRRRLFANITKAPLDFPKGVAPRPLTQPPSPGTTSLTPDDDGDSPVTELFSPAARAFVSALMTRDPAIRLGTAGDVAEVCAHQFFAGINWSDLIARRVSPPFVPHREPLASASVATMTRFFDAAFTSMPPTTSLDMENHTSATAQPQNPPADLQQHPQQQHLAPIVAQGQVLIVPGALQNVGAPTAHKRDLVAAESARELLDVNARAQEGIAEGTAQSRVQVSVAPMPCAGWPTRQIAPGTAPHPIAHLADTSAVSPVYRGLAHSRSDSITGSVSGGLFYGFTFAEPSSILRSTSSGSGGASFRWAAAQQSPPRQQKRPTQIPQQVQLGDDVGRTSIADDSLNAIRGSPGDTTHGQWATTSLGAGRMYHDSNSGSTPSSGDNATKDNVLVGSADGTANARLNGEALLHAADSGSGARRTLQGAPSQGPLGLLPGGRPTAWTLILPEDLVDGFSRESWDASAAVEGVNSSTDQRLPK